MVAFKSQKTRENHLCEMKEGNTEVQVLNNKSIGDSYDSVN